MQRKFAALGLLLGLLAWNTPMSAQGDVNKLSAGKCAGCHAADGTGSAVGKKLGTQDFRSPGVQGHSDTQLSDSIAKGKNKMAAYEKSLKPDDIKNLAGYCRDLGK